jgi:hypothetical protein
MLNREMQVDMCGFRFIESDKAITVFAPDDTIFAIFPLSGRRLCFVRFYIALMFRFFDCSCFSYCDLKGDHKKEFRKMLAYKKYLKKRHQSWDIDNLFNKLTLPDD